MIETIESKRLSQTLQSDLINDRSEEVYLVSKILDSNSQSRLAKKLRNHLFEQLPFNEIEWKNHSLIKHFTQSSKSRKKLLKYEELWFQKASNQSMEEFQRFKKIKDFQNIDQLNAEISATLKKDFNLENYYQSASKYDKKTINEEFLMFYNFMNNSRILKKNHLLQILYLPTILKKTADQRIQGYTLMQTFMGRKQKSAMIGISLHPDWFNTELNAVSFKEGFFAIESFFRIFAHEFGHALESFYNLDSRWWEFLNLNINDLKSLGENDDITTVVEHHFRHTFGKEFKNRLLSNKMVIDKAINFLVENIEKKLHNRQKDVYLKFIKWIAVPSQYARTPADSVAKKNHSETEWFAEAFAYYYETVQADQNKIWELWHQFFTKILPKLWEP